MSHLGGQSFFSEKLNASVHPGAYFLPIGGAAIQPTLLFPHQELLRELLQHETRAMMDGGDLLVGPRRFIVRGRMVGLLTGTL